MAKYDYINETGVIVADTSTVKDEVETEYQGVFGDDFVIDDTTPQGVMANAEVIQRRGLMEQCAEVANQINPDFSTGTFLDSIWSLTAAITGIRRTEEKTTIANVELTGVTGTVVIAGTVLLAGDIEFATASDVTLTTGTVTVDVASVEYGAFTVAVGELNAIKQGAPFGLETVNNTSASVAGRLDESDPVSRLRRKDTLALQGVGTTPAIKSALNNVDGVKSISYLENKTKADDTIDGIFLLANSIYACVDGGIDLDIAEALHKSKGGGSAYNGSETVVYNDGQDHTVKFDRPTELQRWVRVTIRPTTITNPSAVIKAAVVDYANGDIAGEKGFVVGADTSPFEIAAAVNSVSSGLFITLVEVSADGTTYQNSVISTALDEVARTSSSQVNVVIS